MPKYWVEINGRCSATGVARYRSAKGQLIGPTPPYADFVDRANYPMETWDKGLLCFRYGNRAALEALRGKAVFGIEVCYDNVAATQEMDDLLVPAAEKWIPVVSRVINDSWRGSKASQQGEAKFKAVLMAEGDIPLFTINDTTLGRGNNPSKWCGPENYFFSASEDFPLWHYRGTGGSNRVRNFEIAKLRYLVDDAPRATYDLPDFINLGGVEKITVTARNPDGTGVANLAVRLETTGAKMAFRQQGVGVYRPAAVARTNAQGVATFEAKGLEAGKTQFIIRAEDWALVEAFSPPLGVTVTMTVWDPSRSSQPAPQPEPEPDTPVGLGRIEVKPSDGNRPPIDPGTPPTTNCINLPAVDAVPSIPSRVEFRYERAWDAGANSEQSLDGDLRVAFDMQRVVGVVLGITADRSSVGNYARMTHALYFFQTADAEMRVQVMESGKLVSQSFPYVAEDAFEIRRAGGVVEYWKNGAQLHQSRVPSTGAVCVGTSLYATYDTAPGGGSGGPPSGDFPSGGYIVSTPDGFALSGCSSMWTGASAITVTEFRPMAPPATYPACGESYVDPGPPEVMSVPMTNNGAAWFVPLETMAGGIYRLESDNGVVAYADNV